MYTYVPAPYTYDMQVYIFTHNTYTYTHSYGYFKYCTHSQSAHIIYYIHTKTIYCKYYSITNLESPTESCEERVRRPRLLLANDRKQLGVAEEETRNCIYIY